MNAVSEVTFMDLFAGCGGFSEGFVQQGFKPLLHVDFDRAACSTIENRLLQFGYTAEQAARAVVCGDLTHDETRDAMAERLRDKQVDVLVGGPPCQAFSSVGRAQDKNSMRDDPRNYLFRCYLEILEQYKPKFFVFENVTGLLSAKPNGLPIFPEIVSCMSQNYDVCDDKEVIVLNSVHYGVPQVRKRVILVGVRRDLGVTSAEVYQHITKTHYSPEDEKNGQTKGLNKYRTIADAISDLPSLEPGEGQETSSYHSDEKSAFVKLMRQNCGSVIHNHVARNHNSLDRERYRILSANNWQLKDLATVRPDLIHHDPKHFGNRYTVQSYDNPGRTVVAHLYKDGNLFIHPDSKQARTFTVREAARVQSFPDDFIFCGSRTNQYKQVGNAVPPLMAQQIAQGLKYFLA